MKNDLTRAEWLALAGFLHSLDPLLIADLSPMISSETNKQTALLAESGKEKSIKIAKEMEASK